MRFYKEIDAIFLVFGLSLPQNLLNLTFVDKYQNNCCFFALLYKKITDSHFDFTVNPNFTQFHSV